MRSDRDSTASRGPPLRWAPRLESAADPGNLAAAENEDHQREGECDNEQSYDDAESKRFGGGKFFFPSETDHHAKSRVDKNRDRNGADDAEHENDTVGDQRDQRTNSRMSATLYLLLRPIIL